LCISCLIKRKNQKENLAKVCVGQCPDSATNKYKYRGSNNASQLLNRFIIGTSSRSCAHISSNSWNASDYPISFFFSQKKFSLTNPQFEAVGSQNER
jgi:hypothetical protein